MWYSWGNFVPERDPQRNDESLVKAPPPASYYTAHDPLDYQNRNSLSCTSGRGPSHFLRPNIRGYVMKKMCGLIPSPNLKGRKVVCSASRGRISM